ncbi:MAG: hypothetical protein ACYST6_19625 [Planctomycetota bacterium]|jgi:hypothetical protein
MAKSDALKEIAARCPDKDLMVLVCKDCGYQFNMLGYRDSLPGRCNKCGALSVFEAPPSLAEQVLRQVPDHATLTGQATLEIHCKAGEVRDVYLTTRRKMGEL